jgi:hypothetical protein
LIELFVVDLSLSFLITYRSIDFLVKSEYIGVCGLGFSFSYFFSELGLDVGDVVYEYLAVLVHVLDLARFFSLFYGFLEHLYVLVHEHQRVLLQGQLVIRLVQDPLVYGELEVGCLDFFLSNFVARLHLSGIHFYDALLLFGVSLEVGLEF